MTIHTKTVSESTDMIVRSEKSFQTTSMSPVTTTIHTFNAGNGNKQVFFAEIHVVGTSANSSGIDAASYIFHCEGESDQGGEVMYLWDVNETLHLSNELGDGWTASIATDSPTDALQVITTTAASSAAVDWQVWAKITFKITPTS
jgi:hypothetical protein